MKRSFFHIPSHGYSFLEEFWVCYWLAQLVVFEFDLTEKNVFSIHPGTEKVLAQITEPLHVDYSSRSLKICLEECADFKNLSKETVEPFDAYQSEPNHFLLIFDPLKVDQKEARRISILSLGGLWNQSNQSICKSKIPRQQAPSLFFPGFFW